MDNRKSKRYLEYIRQQPCCVTGRMGVEAHHEAIFTTFSAKTHNDFNAVPLCRKLHEERHSERTNPELYWAEWQVDPEQVALIQLKNYLARMQLSWFSTPREFDEEIESVEEHIRVLQAELAE